jgi:RNA polymerase sigma factor (TIGR02999 family)
MENRDGEPLAGTLTRLIDQIDAGDDAAQVALCELVYNELRAIGRRARRRGPGCSLATTDIVHEFLGGILAKGRLGQMKNRRYFYAAAANQMRRLLIDQWRLKHAKARGGDRQREALEPWLDEMVDSAASRCGGDLEALDAALTRLKDERPREYEIVQLKFFAGLTNEQIAKTIGISVDTVKRDWQRARARLGAMLIDDP